MPEKRNEITDLLKDINLKLSLVLGEIVRAKNDAFSTKDSIEYLYKLGLDSKNIAMALGISPDRAYQEISRLRKAQKNDSEKIGKLNGKKNEN